MNLILSSILLLSLSLASIPAWSEASAIGVSNMAAGLRNLVDNNTTAPTDKACGSDLLQATQDNSESTESLVPVMGGNDLVNAYSWADLEGAQVSKGQLCVNAVDRSIVGMPSAGEDSSTEDWLPGHPHEADTPNPPISFLGPHIETRGPFVLKAKFNSEADSGAFLNLYGRVPVIQDEHRREGEALAFGLLGGKAVVKLWDGKSAAPKVYQFGEGLKGEISLSIEKTANAFVLRANGRVMGSIPDPGVFKSGLAFLGADVAKGNRMCLSDISVSEARGHVGKTKVSTMDPFKEIPVDPKALRAFADKRGLNFGTCVSISALMTDPAYRKRLADNFNMVTPENAMKFQFIHPAPGTYTFNDADAIVKFAKANHMKVHAHTLVWGEANSRWITEGNFSNEQLREIIHDHIKTVVGHFKGSVAEWDVLNEPLEDDGSLRQTIWAKALGADYPAIIFKWAHEADPNAKLFINEYGADGMTNKDGSRNLRADALAKLVLDIRAKGGHVDGVGLQMHDNIKEFYKKSSIEANMKRFNDLGIENRISEMDVSMDDSSAQHLKKQAEIFREGLKSCLDNSKNCHTFSMWGFEDKWSSLQNSSEKYSPSEGLGHGMLLDKEGKPKPAYRAIQKTLEK